MIGIRDTFTLAFTKLRTKPFRLVVTVLLAGLLFGVLVAASLVMTGALRSVASFREDGLTNRHIVAVHPRIIDGDVKDITRNPELINEVKRRYEALVEEKIAEAKRLGIRYTQASDQPPYSEMLDGGGDRLRFSDPNGITQKLLEERFGDMPALDDVRLRETAKEYGAIDIYTGRAYTIAPGSALISLKNGNEQFSEKFSEESAANMGLGTIDTGTFVEPSQVTRDFMLPNNAGWQPSSGTLPLILPQNKIQQLLNMPAPSKDANARDKMQHLVQLREKAANATVKMCYRNNASLALIQQTVTQQKEMKAGEGREDYVKPTVMYELPDASKCENPQIVSDTRTAEEKRQTDNQAIFDKKFGLTTDPKSYFVTFKVVGISPRQSTSPNDTNKMESLDDVVTNLLTTSGVGQAVPSELYDQLPNKADFADILDYTPLYWFGNEDNARRYIEFANATDAQRFTREQGCTTQPAGECLPVNHPYQIMSQFSNSAAIDDIQRTARQWFYYAAIGTAILAVIIMWIAIGRTIADGRRETAVFRAVGFKRFDIASVYLLYTGMLTLLVTLFAAGIGYAVAYVLNQRYAADLTVQAQYGFGALDLSKEVSLIGADYTQLGLVLAVCIATGFVSVIVPLLRNVRRNPLKDMREE